MKNYIIRKITSNKNNNFNYKYTNKNNEIISAKKAKSIISNLYIPPAYDNVKINTNNKSKILAIGEDNKGRKQYVYHKNTIKINADYKFKKLIDYGRIYPKILSKINKDSKQNDDVKLKHIATILKIIIDCNFRIGNKIYEKQNKSYGVTTLKKKHMTIKKNHIMIDFIGKKHVRNKCKLTNKHIIHNLYNFQKDKRNNSNIFSFKTNTGIKTISSKEINNYLQNFGDYTSRNIRTWNANTILIKELVNHNSLKNSIDFVSSKLHNTPNVCKSNYLDPKLIKFYEENPSHFINMFKNNNRNKYITFLKKNY
jgi:DNA topoisomerase I